MDATRNDNTVHEAIEARLREEFERVLDGKIDKQIEAEREREFRKAAGLKIDPETAEVFSNYGQVLDPYGLCDLTDEENCIGRNYFARAPGSDVWVWFGDLPDTVRDRLWARIKASEFDPLEFI
jgi:hypothetical protein